MGDIVNALIGAGLAIEWLHSFPSAPGRSSRGARSWNDPARASLTTGDRRQSRSCRSCFYSGTGALISIALTVRKLHVTKGEPLKMRARWRDNTAVGPTLRTTI